MDPEQVQALLGLIRDCERDFAALNSQPMAIDEEREDE